MKTETMIEECILLSHRINKLGGCTFCWECGHINAIDIDVRESKTNYPAKIHYTKVYYKTGDLPEEYSVEFEALETVHAALIEQYNQLKGEQQ